MYVPRRDSPLPPRAGNVPEEVRSAMDRSDCVLAIITNQAHPAVQAELRYALAKNKLVIPIVHSALEAHPLLAQFPRVFTFSPWGNPGKLETDIVQFLREQQLSKEKTQAIGGLVALGVGLLLLFSLSKK